MLDLSFQVQGVEPAAFAAAPMLVFKLGIANRGDEPIHAVLLRAQVQIEATRRRYNAQEQQRLFDLFGPPPEWGRTLRRMLWAQASTNVTGFTGSTSIDLPVPCSYDLNLAVTKYFHGLTEGDVPVGFLFSGTAFYRDAQGAVQVAQIPWENEATFRMPVAVWRAMMDHYYPHSACLCLSRDAVDRLSDYKTRAGLATWEQAVENLLAAEEKVAR